MIGLLATYTYKYTCSRICNKRQQCAATSFDSERFSRWNCLVTFLSTLKIIVNCAKLNNNDYNVEQFLLHSGLVPNSLKPTRGPKIKSIIANKWTEEFAIIVCAHEKTDEPDDLQSQPRIRAKIFTQESEKPRLSSRSPQLVWTGRRQWPNWSELVAHLFLCGRSKAVIASRFHLIFIFRYRGKYTHTHHIKNSQIHRQKNEKENFMN